MSTVPTMSFWTGPWRSRCCNPRWLRIPISWRAFEPRHTCAARLTHPNVVGVYDWGSADELTYYMVMEYVPGKDLHEVMAAPVHCSLRKPCS